MNRKALAFVIDSIGNQKRHPLQGCLVKTLKPWKQTETAKASVLKSPLQAGSSTN